LDNITHIIDANLNRCREGIRVIEDTLRYIHNDTSLTYILKDIRHSIRASNIAELLSSRDIANDIAKQSITDEIRRESLGELIFANFKRAEESLRVLEEYAKLYQQFGNTENFKSARYKLYEIEKTYFETYCDKH